MSHSDESQAVVSSKERFALGFVALAALGAGHIYLGKIKRAFLVVGISLIVESLALVMMASPAGPAWRMYLSIFMMASVPILVLVDVLRLSHSGKSKMPGKSPGRIVLTLIYAVCILILLNGGTSWIKAHYIQAFRMPSGGMMPNLLIGDFFYVDKGSYNSREPVKGEIAAFHYPKDPSITYIKRIVGVPGDMIELRDEILYVNGEKVTSEYLSEPAEEKTRKEVFPDHAYEVLYSSSKGRTKEQEPFMVPDNQYFCLGDNRNNSADSRYWGALSREYLIGPATHIYYSWDARESSIRWDRIGKRIQ